MYEQAGDVAEELGIAREEQDAWAARSQQRAAAAQAAGRLAEEIVPGRPSPAAAATSVVDADEGIRPDTTAETLAGLRPLVPGGTHTAGNSPGVNDGAAAVVRGATRPRRSAAGWVAGPHPRRRATPPTSRSAWRACRRWRRAIALEKAGLTPADVDRWEINEAFASVAVNSTRMLEVDRGPRERQRRRGRPRATRSARPARG